MATQASLRFTANNTAITTQGHVATGNVVINGDGNVVHPPMVHQDLDGVSMSNFMDWLGQQSVNYFPAHDKARVQRALNTGGWFFDKKEYKQWAAVEEKDRRNLECVGIPGAGKTTLASSAIEILQKAATSSGSDTSSIVLYAYFRHDTQATQTVVHVLASLLHQTIQRTNKLSPGMIKLYKDYFPSKDHALAPDRLTEMLQSALSIFKAVYIIVDALDEFCVKDYSLSHPLVRQLQILNAHLMITSRFPVGFTQSTYYTLKISAHADDIRTFVQEHMTGNRDLAAIVACNPSLLDEIVQTIIDKSHGMFVIARLIINCIPDSLTEDEIRASIDDFARTRSLQDVYKLIMKRVQDQRPRLVKLGISALLWVYLAKRRLTIKELRHAVSFTLGSKPISQSGLIGADRIFSACAGLITTVRDGDSDDTGEGGNKLNDESKCQFAHFTAKEFFDKFWQGYFPDGEHQIIETCLAYLTVAVSAIPPELTEHIIHESWMDRDKDDEWQQYQTSKYALYVYASNFWHVHAKAIDGMLSLDAYASLFKHPISPYMIANHGRDGTYIACTIAMRPDHYWILCFARFGLLEHLQWHAAAVQNHDRASELPVTVNYNDVRDGVGWTALHFAARYTHLKVVEFLLDSGADVNQLDSDRDSPLHFAVQAGTSGVSIVQLLLDRGALVDEPGFGQRAPIFSAIKPYYTSNLPSPDIIRLLLQHEVDIYRVGYSGKTPLSLAQQSEHPEIKELLEEYARTDPPKRRAYRHIFLGGHHSASDSESEDDSESDSDPSMTDAASSSSPERELFPTVDELGTYNPSRSSRTLSSSFHGGRQLLIDSSSSSSSSMTRDPQPQPSRNVAWRIQSSSPSIPIQRFASDLSSSLPNSILGTLALDTSSVVRRAREEGSNSTFLATARGGRNTEFTLPGIKELYRSSSSSAEAAQASRRLALAVPRSVLQPTGSTTTQQIPTQSTKRAARTPSPVTFHGKRMKFS